jgi:hypothetical protein
MVKRTTITHMEYYAITTSIKAGKNNQVEKLIAWVTFGMNNGENCS